MVCVGGIGAGMGVFVSANVMGGMPFAVATIVKLPVVPLGVNAGLVTVPPVPIMQIATAPPFTMQRGSPPNVAEAPPTPGVMVKATRPPTTGSALGSVTVRLTGFVEVVFAQ